MIFDSAKVLKDAIETPEDVKDILDNYEDLGYTFNDRGKLVAIATLQHYVPLKDRPGFENNIFNALKGKKSKEDTIQKEVKNPKFDRIGKLKSKLITENNKETAMNESMKEMEDLQYNNLDITVIKRRGNPSGYYSTSFGNWLPDDDETEDITIDYEYQVDKDDVIDALYEFAEDERTASMSDEEYEHFVKDNYDELLEKYYQEVLDEFEDRARDEAEEEYGDQEYAWYDENYDPTKPQSFKEVEDYVLEDKDPFELTDEEKKFVNEEEESKGFDNEEEISWDDLETPELEYEEYEIDSPEYEDEEEWEELASKDVYDSDGFLTTYKWFVKNKDGKEMHIFMFNEDEADPKYADHICGSYNEAKEWFNNYKGFEDEIDYDSFEEADLNKLEGFDMKEELVAEDSKPLTEGRMKDLAIDIENEGGKDKLKAKLFRNIQALESEIDFLENQAPREINAGGNFDNQAEIDKALEETRKALNKEKAKYSILEQ